MNAPHVQVILDENTVPGPLRTALNRVNARVSLRSMDKALASGISPTADVCVILPRKRSTPDVMGRILADASDRACAAMVIPPAEEFAAGRLPPDDPVRRLSVPPDESPSMNADELTGRIKALCEVRSPFRRMREELAELRRREAEHQLGSRHMDEQLRLASEIQRDLLPGPLPDTGPLEVSALYLPADFVSGDSYDVSRLDEEHVGLSLADATGHGLPAALLTIFIRKSFMGKETTGDTHRILEPDEVLRRLNDEMMGTRLSQCQFITGLHAVFDRRTQHLRWARGGVPYPILLQPGRPPTRLPSAGPLLGTFDHPHFEIVDHALQPGDTLLFFTDGLEALLAKHDPAFGSEEVVQSVWLRQISEAGVSGAFEEIRRLVGRSSDQDWQRDDITVLAMRMST